MIRYRNLICDDEERRVKLLAHPTLNGIDYIEVPAVSLDEQRFLHVHFIKSPPPVGLINHPELFRVEGGVRIRNISVIGVSLEADHLKVEVEHSGDFSTYTLIIENQELDPAYARCEFNFKAGCPTRFDCKPCIICLPEVDEEPLIDYMAKDYASFRHALIDLIPTLIPGWQERHEADLGIALVELLSHVGDQLSYYQDAVANEAYLGTARQRTSVRRHARLIDYQVHDGTSARAFIHLRLTEGTDGKVPEGTQILSRIDRPLQSQMPPHGAVIPKELASEALEIASVVFETFKPAQLHHLLNEIEIYAWGNRQCCLPRGTTTMDLRGDLGADLDAAPPSTWKLKAGDFLLVEEIKGPKTWNQADADFNHRQIVRLTKVEKTQDPLENEDLTRVTWGSEDKLIFPLCISARREDDVYEEKISVARGNLILADHGQTLQEKDHPGPNKNVHSHLARAHRIHLQNAPLSFRIPLPVDNDPLGSARVLFQENQFRAMPQVTQLKVDAPATIEFWDPVSPDLLESGPFDPHFVVETDNVGRVILRFGDGTYGMAPDKDAKITVEYRIGVGKAGNVGSESLVHIVKPEPLPFGWPDIAQLSGVGSTSIRNPLPAWGGIDPEPLTEVKQLAPVAFHATQMRAVTADDYGRAAELHPLVDKAVATIRWTGSWWTVFITIDPVGRSEVKARLERQIKAWVTRFTMTGYDLEIDSPIYIPLEIEIDVCVEPNHFRAEVEQAILLALSHRDLPQGGHGFFHWDQFTFGQPLYLSNLYTAIEAIDGVDSALVRRFIRLGTHDPAPEYLPTNENLDRGYIPMDRLEVLRLDNDANFPENGVLRLNMMGGK